MPRTSTLQPLRTVSVTDAVTLVSDATTPWAYRSFRNTSATDSVFYGTSAVAATGTAKGREIKPGEERVINYTNSPIYMIAASGKTVAVSVEEVGQ